MEEIKEGAGIAGKGEEELRWKKRDSMGREWNIFIQRCSEMPEDESKNRGKEKEDRHVRKTGKGGKPQIR